ncbi:hypothetical protein [Paracoccus sediminicola]|uniref:hypothetical protein n=1 Tax=Paracoccus sediminicola TaxID=3017783 RepID=UPI0022F02E2A|nr:hypothetical protein [Paracoccus sediminicola]WBU56882.1 hypothetical protein PAF18_00080 [Paracoccus sediminicola]
MTDAEAVIEEATKALISGDHKRAFDSLSGLEKLVNARPEMLDEHLSDALAHVAQLVRAAMSGMNDARQLIGRAQSDADHVCTYDKKGNSAKLRVVKGAIGRF